jgi:hypothetical protein
MRRYIELVLIAVLLCPRDGARSEGVREIVCHPTRLL